MNRIGKSNAANGRRRSRLPRQVIGERKRIPRNARRQRRRRGRIGIGRVAEKICAERRNSLCVLRGEKVFFRRRSGIDTVFDQPCRQPRIVVKRNRDTGNTDDKPRPDIIRLEGRPVPLRAPDAL